MKLPFRKGRGSPLLGGLLFLITLAVASYFWFQYSVSTQKKAIARLEKLSSRLSSETLPLKFMILSREGGEIKVRLKFYDLSRREIAVMEKSWPGSELYVDMLLVPALSGEGGGESEAWLAFPYRIFTDSLPAASGTLLFDAYDGSGFPEVFEGADWSAKERASLVSIFAAARKRAAAGVPATDAAKGAFGSAVHEVARIAKLDTGVVYKIVCRIKGGVEIAED
jgi:hypothetical protein